MIEIGDYIQSDFFSPVQGFVESIGTIGKRIPAYKVKDLIGKTHFIIVGQAELLWTQEEWDKPETRLCHYPRHD